MALANCHIHLPPNFSAFGSIAEAVDAAAREEVPILGASNYYDFRVYGLFSQLCAAAGIQPLFGIEIVCWDEISARRGDLVNDPGNPGKTYLCGKGLKYLDDPSAAAALELKGIRERDEARIAQMADLLAELAALAGMPGGPFAPQIVETVAERAGVPAEAVVLQERHLAQAYQEHFFRSVEPGDRVAVATQWFGAKLRSGPEDAVGIQGELRSHLIKAGKPAYVAESFIPLSDAISLIRELGGLVAYPVVADGMTPRSAFEEDPERLATRLEELGIDTVEFIPNRNRPEVLSEYCEVLNRRGFRLTAGTEHNTLERLPIEPRCKAEGNGGLVWGDPIPEHCAVWFQQGAEDLVECQTGVRA